MAVIGVFLMGIVVTGVAIIHIVQIYKLFFVPSPPGTDNYHDIGLTTSSIEVNLAIFSACVPALRPLFRRWMPKLFGGTNNKQSTEPGYYKYATGSRRNHTGTRGEDDMVLKEMRSRAHCTEIRSASPTGSEEEIMTYNGIVRTTNFNVHYESNVSVDDSRSSGDFESGESLARGTAL
ncbi:CFEM domain-containing protein [Colletotrichum tofieldiae]|nr:CFEM domain-containing protein [Colletotrichum tofieldiae]